MKKRIISLFLVTLALFSMVLPASAANIGKELVLSSLTENECINFVKNAGVDIPDNFATNPNLGAFLKQILTEYEKDPNYRWTANFTVTQKFYDDLRVAVNKYKGYTFFPELPSTKSVNTDTTQLKDSYLYSSWTNSCQNYNCYSYVLGVTDDAHDPGFYSGKSYTILKSLSTLRDYVIDDLVAEFGVSRNSITYQTTAPSAASVSGKNVICIRTGKDAFGNQDYHFMKFFGSSAGWRHKPGESAILKYKYTPTYSRAWTNEAILKTGYSITTMEYTGTIYFIIYP